MNQFDAGREFRRIRFTRECEPERSVHFRFWSRRVAIQAIREFGCHSEREAMVHHRQCLERGDRRRSSRFREGRIRTIEIGQQVDS